MRQTTGKAQWNDQSSVFARIPASAYVVIAVAGITSAGIAGWTRGYQAPTPTGNVVANIQEKPAATPIAPITQPQATAQPLLASLFTRPPSGNKEATDSKPTESRSTTEEIIAQISASSPAKAADHAPLLWETLTVKSGDSFSSLMERAGFSTQAWYEVINLGSATKALTQLRVGDFLKVVKSDQRVHALDFKLNAENTLQVRRKDGSLSANTHVTPIERRTVSATGVIENAFYNAANKAQLPDNIIMELADLFAWDINFALDTRAGDNFSVLYEEKYQNGKRIGTGNILAAEFVNKGKSYRTVRYTDANNKTNYYTPDGRSMRRAFLRSPVHFTRISSKFNPNRLHPIYKTRRPHRGVDYAAPRGTPIMSAGDGVVTFSGVKTGYGNVVIIKHGERYSTLYAHMNSFAKGMRRGKRVTQGQMIGRVGSTGWATGPHLHYEFQVDGSHRNPLTVKLPLAQPIEKRFRRDFSEHSAPMMAWLDALTQTQVAFKQD